VETLRDRINRIAYVVINVSDLERSRRFYETVLGLQVTGEIAAPLQPFRGLGIDEGRFDGLVLQDRTGGDPTAIHLVRWRTPAPVGAPYPVFWNVGLAKIALLIPDLDEKIALLRRLGLRPTNATIHRRYLTVLDPDGTIISMPESPQLGTAQLVHTNVSARDVRETNAFYGELLGLTLRTQSIPCEPLPVSQGPGSDRAQWDSHLFSSRGDGRFHIDISQFHFPPPTRETLTPYDEANHLGIVRVGFEVDDLDAARQILLRALGQGVGEPEAWDYGPLGARRVVALRDPNGVRLELVEERLAPRQTRCRNPTFNPPPIVF
jgi:catechol 2,3-dioxygenase-like lactoylglutathione lyase family enzyme